MYNEEDIMNIPGYIVDLITRKEITPEYITELEPGEIFVFGSNLSGRHDKGAAKAAMKWGAIYGQAEGLQGRTYAIPTVNHDISNAISLKEIAGYVQNFYNHVRNDTKHKYLLTPIGCGLAGYTPKDIFPMFVGLIGMDHVTFPYSFMVEYLNQVKEHVGCSKNL